MTTGHYKGKRLVRGMNGSAGVQLPEVDVHICVLREGESLYIPDTISDELGLGRGGSYVLVRVNDMVVIAPRQVTADATCAQLQDARLDADNTVCDVLDRVEAARSQ